MKKPIDKHLQMVADLKALCVTEKQREQLSKKQLELRLEVLEEKEKKDGRARAKKKN